jgi:hypothetical protein
VSRRPVGRIAAMSTHALELIFIGLLVAATLAIGWIAELVVLRLFKGQR